MNTDINKYNWTGLVVKVTTESGHNWKTEINGDLASAKDYFLGQTVNIGSYPVETMEKVVNVEDVTAQ